MLRKILGAGFAIAGLLGLGVAFAGLLTDFSAAPAGPKAVRYGVAGTSGASGSDLFVARKSGRGRQFS